MIEKRRYRNDKTDFFFLLSLLGDKFKFLPLIFVLLFSALVTTRWMLSKVDIEMTVELMLKNGISKFISCDKVYCLLMLNVTDQKMFSFLKF